MPGPIAPLGASRTWSTVIAAAGGRCQCEGGVCGSRHSKTDLRCDRDTEHRDRLIVAPADLTLSPVAAAAVPVAELRAWCADCHRKATTRQKAAERERLRQSEPATDALFEI
jgi:hypothetical protein